MTIVTFANIITILFILIQIKLIYLNVKNVVVHIWQSLSTHNRMSTGYYYLLHRSIMPIAARVVLFRLIRNTCGSRPYSFYIQGPMTLAYCGEGFGIVFFLHTKL